MASLSDVTTQAKLRVERARARYGLVDVTLRTFKRYSEDDGGFSAASLTYYMFFSIFPLMLVAGSVLGFITFLNEDIKQRLLRQSLDAVPLLRDILDVNSLRALENQRGTLAVVGLLLGLYAGSGGVVALEHALNKIARVEHEPGFVPKRVRSLKWLALLALAAAVSLGMGTLAGFAGAIFGDGSGVSASAGRLLASILLHIGGFAVGAVIFITAFKLLPAARQSWRDVLPGALVAAAAFEVLKIVGTWYLEQGAEGRQATFGAFATAAGLLVASYLLAQVTLIAAELNSVLAERRATRGPPGGSGREEA
jgi:membrane protein